MLDNEIINRDKIDTTLSTYSHSPGMIQVLR